MKNNRRIYISIGVILLVMTLIVFFAFRQEAQTINTPVVDYEQRDNILLIPNRNPSQQDIDFRLKKNRKYNSRINRVVEAEGGIVIKEKSGHWTSKVPLLPIRQSDEIVIGTVKAGRAFLSDDRTGIYSEFLISVEKILKLPSLLNELDEITLERAGGAVRFPSGKIQRIFIYNGQEMPQPNARYIFFLKSSGEERSYSILTGYDLTGNNVRALDRIEPYRKFDNENVNSFLNRLTQVINNPNIGGD